MTDAGFEISNQAVAAIFGSGGFLVAVLTQYVGGRKNKTPSMADCEKTRIKNELEHKEFSLRIGVMETKGAVSEAVVARIDKSLDEINKKIDDLAR